jgi:antitoxin (DNA-binding transcriptional repressor) of toxin-antitoxin stability system
MGLDNLKDGIVGFVQKNPVGTAIGAGAAVIGTGAVIAAVAGHSSKKKNRRSHTRRGWKLDRKKFNKSQKWEVAYRRRKRKHKKGSKRSNRRGKIHYAKKTGQPYIIKANGQAKFIKGRRKK